MPIAVIYAQAEPYYDDAWETMDPEAITSAERDAMMKAEIAHLREAGCPCVDSIKWGAFEVVGYEEALWTVDVPPATLAWFEENDVLFDQE